MGGEMGKMDELDLANKRRAALAKLLAWAMETGRILDRENHAAEVHGDGTDCPVCDHMQTEQAYEWLQEAYAELDAWREYAEVVANRRRAALADDVDEFFVAMANGKATDRLRDLHAANRGAMRMHAKLSAWREYAQTCEAALRAVVDEVQS